MCIIIGKSQKTKILKCALSILPLPPSTRMLKNSLMSDESRILYLDDFRILKLSIAFKKVLFLLFKKVRLLISDTKSRFYSILLEL